MAEETKTPEGFTYRATYDLPLLLSGAAASPQLDHAVAAAVSLGLEVSRVRSGAYRVQGPYQRFDTLKAWMANSKVQGVSADYEMPPDLAEINLALAPTRQPMRTAEIHASQPAGSDRLVARAIDAGLSVRCVSLGRFAVTGSSTRLVAWLAVTKGTDRAGALAILGVAEADIAAEDAAPPPIAVAVSLPVRETSSVITRDSSGNIKAVVQTERDVPPAEEGAPA